MRAAGLPDRHIVVRYPVNFFCRDSGFAAPKTARCITGSGKVILQMGVIQDILPAGRMMPPGSIPVPYWRKNPAKIVLVLSAKKLFLLRCRLLRGRLCFRLLCRCLLCCCHVGIHLLPERVIFLVNLTINKYFGRNGILRPRIAHNHHFFQWKWALFPQ